MSTNNDTRQFSLRKKLKLNHIVDILGADNAEAENQERLGEMQRDWLNLGHALTAAEHLWDLVFSIGQETCDTMGDYIMCIGGSLALACVPNVARIVCNIVKLVGIGISYSLLISVTIAHQAVDDIFEIATLGELYCLVFHTYAIMNFLRNN